jgi:hypothetical protein
MTHLVLMTVDDPLRDFVWIWGGAIIFFIPIIFLRKSKNFKLFLISLIGGIGVLTILTVIFFGLAVKEAFSVNEPEMRVAAYEYIVSNGVRVVFLFSSIVLLGIHVFRKRI